MKLFEFAYCKDFNNKINFLATICIEDWGNPDSYKTHPVLHNYIKHTFSKLYFDFETSTDDNKDKIFVLRDGNCFIFNTGLYDLNWQKIYAYFTPNRNNNLTWYFEAFLTEYTLRTMGINAFPDRANYFNNMKDLIFDVNYEIIPQYDHIFGDENNNQRIPESIRNNFMKQQIFDSAIINAKKRIDANYKVAVPQYFDNKIQLLIPLYLTSPIKPDLALVLTRDDTNKCYLGHTCLTTEWAYNNARLIAKPDSDWLVP
jgi:hypothetical protein